MIKYIKKKYTLKCTVKTLNLKNPCSLCFVRKFVLSKKKTKIKLVPSAKHENFFLQCVFSSKKSGHVYVP